MNPKVFLTASVAALTAAGMIAAHLVFRHRSIQPPPATTSVSLPTETSTPIEPTPTSTSSDEPSKATAEIVTPPSATENLAPAPSESHQQPSPSRTASAPTQPVPKRKPEPQAPDARYALSYVGEDPIAEEIWHEAINDPSVPPHERQDLIEDLNEDGFPDPHHITEDDLPLILNRLALIEDAAPQAMDEVNAKAFAEAYKDLVNMLNRLAQQ